MKLIIHAILLLVSLSVYGSEIVFSNLKIRVFPIEYKFFIGKKVQEPLSTANNIREYLIPSDTDMFFLRSEGFQDKYIFRNQFNNLDPLEIKMEQTESPLRFMDILKTGSQPKSVEFSINGNYFAVALLNGEGVEIYSLKNMELIHFLSPPIEWSEKKGFVETVFFATRNEIWVSQMTTGMIHVFDTLNWKYKLSFDCGGSWPKVITLNKNEDTAYISNWISKNISIINTIDYKVEKNIQVNGIPRGMAISPDEKFLYVGNYTSGDINKIDIEKKILLKNIDLGEGALRHVVISEDKNRLYVSDMFHGTVTVLNLKTDAVVRSFYAGSNINTIKLSPDGKKLFISSRGHNNKNGYLQKGPDFGKIYVYDTVLNKITNWIWGGNQPTGLAVSPNGDLLIFSDFLDQRVEIYRIQTQD